MLISSLGIHLPPPASGTHGLLHSSKKWRMNDNQVGGGQGRHHQKTTYSKVQISPRILATLF